MRGARFACGRGAERKAVDLEQKEQVRVTMICACKLSRVSRARPWVQNKSICWMPMALGAVCVSVLYASKA